MFLGSRLLAHLLESYELFFFVSFLMVHLSPGGILVAISSLCSVVLVVGELFIYIYIWYKW